MQLSRPRSFFTCCTPLSLLASSVMSLAAFLPPPRYAALEPDSPPASPPLLAAQPSTSSTSTSLLTGPTVVPPPYGRRQGFVPRSVADFGSGGAFPEIPIPQYPLSMEQPAHTRTHTDTHAAPHSASLSLILHSSSSSTTPVQYSSDGSVRYDAIVQQGRPTGVTVQSSYTDMAAKQVREDELARPTAEEEAKAVEETRRALGVAMERRLATSSSTYIRPHNREASFVRYTPTASSVHHNSGASSRLIRLTEAPVDPLQPMMLKHQKLPASVPDGPVPLMHSPPRKLTTEDVAAWKIPPCIPNWKNSKGYTIALDKRMASDGRGLQTVEVSDKFAQLSESLFVAERVAREEIEQRADVRQGLRRREKEEKEDELRVMAEEARRSVAVKPDSERSGQRESESYAAAEDGRVKAEQYGGDEDEAGRRERDELRRDRQNELKRSMLLQRQKEMRGGKISSVRDEDRDISEKIALGQAAPSTATSSLPFDSRLFNQSEGLSGGFTSDDTYSIYDRPLFQGSGGSGLYRPRETAVDDEAKEEGGGIRGKADKPFKGTEGISGGGRVRPVEFEREDDPFGLGSLLSEASRSAEEERKDRERDRYRDEHDRDRAEGQRRQSGSARWAEEEQQEEGESEAVRRGRSGYRGGSEPQYDQKRRSRSRSRSPDRQRGQDRDERDSKRTRY